MAGNAKVKSIGVSWGYHDADELIEAGAELVINDYSELHQAIQNIMEA